MNLGPLGIPEVPMIGRYNYARAQRGLHQHLHPGVMEICFLAKGMQLYRVGVKDYLLRGGDVFVTFPDEVHGTGESPQEKGVLYWVQFLLPESGGRFLSQTSEDSEKLVSALLAIKRRHFEGSSGLETLLEEIFGAAQASDPLRHLAIVTKLVRFLLMVLDDAKGNPKSAISSGISNLLRYVEAHVDERLTIPMLAARLGLSTSRFKARFKDEVGIPPAEYILRSRVEASKNLLRKEFSITDCAFQLGFSSSQHFATVFKRYTGLTPRGYQSRIASGTQT